MINKNRLFEIRKEKKDYENKLEQLSYEVLDMVKEYMKEKFPNIPFNIEEMFHENHDIYIKIDKKYWDEHLYANLVTNIEFEILEPSGIYNIYFIEM